MMKINRKRTYLIGRSRQNRVIGKEKKDNRFEKETIREIRK